MYIYSDTSIIKDTPKEGKVKEDVFHWGGGGGGGGGTRVIAILFIVTDKEMEFTINPCTVVLDLSCCVML